MSNGYGAIDTPRSQPSEEAMALAEEFAEEYRANHSTGKK